MMLMVLMVSILIISMLQKRKSDIESCAFFCIPMLILWLLPDSIDGWLYYFSNAFGALVSISFLSIIKNKLSSDLTNALFISMLLNLFGYVTWFFYMPASVYQISFHAWYLWIIFLILRTGNLRWNFLRSFGVYWHSFQSYQWLMRK